MTKFGIPAAWPSGPLVMAAILTVGGLAGVAAAQSAKAPAKPKATANQESNKDLHSTTAAEAPEGQASDSAAPAAGLKVVKDPETGKLRGPDRAEAAKLNGPGMNRSIQGLRAVQLPNGVTVVDLEGRFQSFTVATIKPDGGIEIECQNSEPGHSHAADENSNARTGTAQHGPESVATVSPHGK